MNSATSDSDEARLAAARGNYATAVRLWRHLADGGDPVAQFNLGFCYAQGHGVARDKIQAAQWYRLAAEQGHGEAQYRLGLYCEDEGVKDAPEVATHWYFKKENEAAKWYSEAAMQGHSEAQYRLGLLCIEESEFDPDKFAFDREAAEGAKASSDAAAESATEWLRMAAEKGHADAQFLLGQRYRHSSSGDGRNGASKENYAEALKWYRDAAMQGHPSAQFSLGIMSMNGEGMEQDLLQAYMWFDLVASREADPKHRAYLIDMRTTVAQKMTSAQTAEAQKLRRKRAPK